MCRFFPTPTTNSPTLQTPTECPTFQFISDTIYLELASDSTGIRTQFHKTVLTSDASHKYWVPTLLFDWAIKLGIPPHTHLRFNNLLE